MRAKVNGSGTEEGAGQLRALAGLVEDLCGCSQPSATRVLVDLMPSSGLCRHQARKWCTDIHPGQTSIHVLRNINGRGFYRGKLMGF